jgi:hypothetical protein
MIKKIIVTAFFFSIIINFGYGQEKIYLDENMKTIDSLTFHKKCNTRVLGCLEYKRKQVMVYSVYKHYAFGKISQNEFEKVKFLLNQTSNDVSKKNQSYILHFKDTMFGYYKLAVKRLEKAKKVKLNQLNALAQNQFYKEASSIAKKRVSTHFEYIKSYNEKCIRLLKKFNTKDYYIFNEDVGYIKKYGENKNWIKNDSLLNSLFFGKHPKASYVIIKPNGNYFISNLYIPKSNYLLLLKKDDWTKFEQDLAISIKKNSTLGKGFFRNKDLFANNECISEY